MSGGQPTMAELRAARDRLKRDETARTLLVEQIATMDAQNLGFPTIADSDVPEVHRIFARKVLAVIAKLA
jgi:hypothetical protein